MFQKRTFAEVVDLAEHFIAIGETEVYLHDEPYPWELVTRVEPGGVYRFEMPVSIAFYARHRSGIEFRWTFDMEERDANGTNYHHVRVSELMDVIQRIPVRIRRELHNFLMQWATALREKGNEYMAIAEHQFGKAIALERMAVPMNEG